MLGAPQHRFIIFTKQPQNIDDELDELLPSNLSIGVSVNRKEDLWRIDVLREIECQCRILSFEPLYEDLGRLDLEGIGWVIIGAQTRPKIFPQKEWVDHIDNQATCKDIPVFFKNNLREMGLVGWVQEYPDALKVEEVS
jgi:protein gp37